MMWQLARFAITAVLAVLSASLLPAQTQSAQLVPGMEQLYRLDSLPRYKDSIKIGTFSSYDRTGGNDDGGSGKYSFLRKEGGALVIAEMTGPGIIYRIWTPTPTDDTIEFYFDGETAPSLKLRFSDLFSGKQPPFSKPVVGSGAGGYFSYVPLPYRRSCKVVLRGERLQYYQINYATYAPGAAIQSYKSADPAEYSTRLAKAQQFLASTGSDLSAMGAAQGTVKTTNTRNQLAPGQTLNIFQANAGGRVVGLRIGPASAFAGKDRDVLLNIYWDGDTTPSISVPLGDFFGYSFGEPAMRSLLVGTDANTNYAYFPMPYDKSARIDVVSERHSGAPIDLEAAVQFTQTKRSNDEGRFYALWRRENPTAQGVPFTFVKATGRGHLVGFTLQAQGEEPGNTEFFEGDDQTTIDGELAIIGTGSEDFFNGGWYDVPGRWEKRSSFPLSGCLDYKKPLGRSAGYRFLLSDAYPFRRSILQTIEHGPEGNKYPAEYTGVTYMYAEQKPAAAGSVPPVLQRRVTDPERVVFTPGWNVPIESFSFENASLEKHAEMLAGKEVRLLMFKAHDRDIFGEHYIAFLLEAPKAGRYNILVQGVEGPAQGRLQLFENDLPVASAADFYAPQRVVSAPRAMGAVHVEEGQNRIFFKIVGKSPDSSALGVDFVRVYLEQVR